MAALTLRKPSNRVQKPAPAEPTLNDKVNAYQLHLERAYPTLFDPARLKPLAIGIHQALLKTRPEGTSKTTVRRFLARWTHRKAYRQAVATGGHRFGLNGMPDGCVLAEQQEHAK
jgi:ProP effector